MLFAYQDGRVGHRQLFGDEVNMVSGTPYPAYIMQFVELAFTAWLALQGAMSGSSDLWSGSPARVVRSL